jgi:hypothetical protein
MIQVCYTLGCGLQMMAARNQAWFLQHANGIAKIIITHREFSGK